MDTPSTILIVDDDRDIRSLLADYLESNGYRALAAADGTAMWKILDEARPDLIVLDLNLPGDDGLTLCRKLRAHSTLPVIMLTARNEPLDRILGLEMGADDYLPKPFEPRELLARIKSVLRRTGEAPAAVPTKRIRMGRRILDLERHILIEADGSEETLSASEFDLLKVFAENPNRPLMRDWLLEVTAHREMEAFDRAIDLRITRLRRKIEVDPSHPDAIRTVRGVGYMFVPPKD